MSGSRSLRSSVGLLGASKASALVLQLAGVSLGTRYCGATEYAGYLAVFAAALIPALILIRLSPSYVGFAIGARAHLSDRNVRKHLHLGVLAVVAGGLVYFLLVVALWLISVAFELRLFESQFPARYSSVFLFLVINAGLLSMVAAIEAMQTGFHQIRILSAWILAANLTSLALLVTLLPRQPDVVTLALILNLPQLIARLLNAITFPLSNPGILARSSPDLTSFLSLVRESLLYTGWSGVTKYATFQAPILLMNRLWEAPDPWAAVMFQLLVQGLGALNLLLLPGLPVLVADLRSGELSRARKVEKSIVGFVFLIGLVLAVAILLLPRASGSFILTSPHLLLCLAAFLLFVCCGVEEYLSGLILMSASGTSRRWVYGMALVRAVVFLCLVVAFASLKWPLAISLLVASGGYLLALPVLFKIAAQAKLVARSDTSDVSPHSRDSSTA